MKFSYTFFSALSLGLSLSGVSAQDTTGIPSCAISCLSDAISKSSCSLTDAVCQCTTGQATITAAVTPCVLSKCSLSDASLVQPAAEALCSKALASASASGTASSKATSTAKTTASSASAAATNAAAPIRAGEYVVAVAVAVGALAL